MSPLASPRHSTGTFGHADKRRDPRPGQRGDAREGSSYADVLQRRYSDAGLPYYEK